MAKQLKLRRGTTAEHSTFIGAECEVTVDTTKDTLVVHDGVQAGGFPVATERDATPRTSTTGSTKVPSGTEAQRDASPQAGYFRFNTESGKFEGYNGTEWGAIAGGGEASFVAFEYIATAGQTTFSGNDANGVYLSYTPNSVQVMLNGVALQPGNDYTATNATSVVLTSGAAVGDEVTIYAFNTFEVADTYTRAQADVEFFRKAGEDGLTLDGTFIQMKSAAGQGTGFEFAANGGVVGTDSLFVGEGTDGTGYLYHRGNKTVRLGTSNLTRYEIDGSGNHKSNIPGQSGTYPEFKCRAWVNFNGTGTVAIRASGNVSSITDIGTGNYRVNLTTGMPDTNYAPIASGYDDGVNPSVTKTTTPNTVSQAILVCSNSSNTLVDVSVVTFCVFR